MIIAYKEDMPQVKIELRGRNGEIEYDAYLSTGTFKCLIPEGEKGFALLLEMWCEVERRDRFCSVCGASVTKVVTQEFLVSADNLIEKVNELLHEGNVTRIIVKDEKRKVLPEIPATVGVIGVVLAPWLAALGVIAALATNCAVFVGRRE